MEQNNNLRQSLSNMFSTVQRELTEKEAKAFLEKQKKKQEIQKFIEQKRNLGWKTRRISRAIKNMI